MKMIFKKMRVGLFLLGVSLLSACGEGPAVNRYLGPVWMPDGRIMVMKQVIHTSGGTGMFGTGSGGEASESFLAVMNADGTNEQNVISMGQNGYIIDPNCSPSGNLMATDHGNRLDIYSTETWKVVATIDCSNSTMIYEYDWSPDGEKIAIRVDSGVKLYSKMGVFIRDLTNLRVLYAWKYYPYIFGDYRLGGVSSEILARLVDENNMVVSDNMQAYGPQEFLPGGQEYVSGRHYFKFRTSDFTQIFDYRPFLESLGRYYGKIRPNPINPNQVMFSDDIYISKPRGIVLINLDGTGKLRIR